MNPHIDAILSFCETASFVSLNEEKLLEVTQRFAQEDLVAPDWRAPVFLPEDSAEFIDFLGVGNSINFCFRDLETKQRFRMQWNGQYWEGAFGMWASLRRALEQGLSVLDAEFLSRMDLATARHIFRGDPPLPMMEERVSCLRLTGATLLRKYGSFSELFGESGFRTFDNGCGIVERLANDFPSYQDVSIAPSGPLPFYKRANLLVLMYQGRALASDGALLQVRDIADLTPPADYEIPKAFKHVGVLEYHRDLERMIQGQIPLPKDSRYEMEPRAFTVLGMTRSLQEINRLRAHRGKNPITYVELDYKFWSEGRNSPEPHHLTETTAY